MNLFEYNFNGVNYEFKMSNNAKVRIEEAQSKALGKFNDDSKVLECMQESKTLDEKSAQIRKELEEKIKGLDEEKASVVIKEYTEKLEALSTEFTLKHGQALQIVNQIGEIINPIELGYILLTSRSQHKNLTKDEYEELIENMEDNLGFEDVQNKFKEIHEKVFLLMGKLTTSQKPKKKTKK